MSVPKAPRILIVDDDASQRSLLDSFLRSQHFETIVVDSGERALEVLRREPISMMISDVRMPGLSGLDTLRLARQEHAVLPVLLVTAYADIRDAVDAMRDGAVNYLAKPIDLDELLASVRKATGMESSAPSSPVADRSLPSFVVAKSPLTQAVFREASLVAGSDSRILITGESGVGKEVVADVIHLWSARANGPIIKFNCAAIPEALLESELFGHEKGAFTGAYTQRIGRFEEAHNGSILLDEIAEMPLYLQAKLLRVTQDGRFQRVGSNKELHTNARIFAATNRDLEKEVEAGKFREDLFYRLNVMEIFIPPLRERREDIIPLASFFAKKFAKSEVRFSSAVIRSLEHYRWPGNVRELMNAMERAALLSHAEVILPEHLPMRIRQTASESVEELTSQAQKLEDIEREAILRCLREHNFNRSEAARALGISRRALLYKLQRFREQGLDVGPSANDAELG
jgi:DNA-binding NtrC family response regulator